MDKKRNLAKNTVIILLGKFCTQFLAFFLLPLYTKYLTTEEYGTYDLINTYLILLVPIISLELSDALFRFLIDTRKNIEKEKQVLSSIVYGILIAITIVGILAVIVDNFMKIKFLYYILFNVIMMTFSNIALQSARGLGNNKVYSIGSVITALCTIIISSAFLKFTKYKVEGILIATGIANLLCAIYIFVDLKLYNKIKVKAFRRTQLSQALKYSMPLIPNSISWWIINVSDRTMISTMVNVGANGIYSVANKFSSAFVSLYTVFNLSWSESASLSIEDSDKDKFFNETINQMMRLFSSMGIGLIACMPFIFNIFVDSNYNEAYCYIPLLIIGSILNIFVGLISAIYVAKKMTNEIAKTSILSALINIGINIFAINWFGIYGACISTICAFLVMFIYRYIDLQKHIKLMINFKFIISLIIIIIISGYLYYKNYFWGNIINLIIVIIYAIKLNEKFLKEFKNVIKEKIHRKK